MRKPILTILCALCLVIATSYTSANYVKDFGTVVAVLQDDAVSATCPDIQDFDYSISQCDNDDHLDVNITCIFTDDANGAYNFSFNFLLWVDLWDANTQSKLRFWGDDEWAVVDENSAFWLNQNHTQNISVTIFHQTNWFYKCYLDVYIINLDADVSDFDSVSWNITMSP